MKVLWASTWLATGGFNGTLGAQWNESQVNDEAEFFRAAAVTFFARGNRSTRFSFSVFMPFDSEGECMTFAATAIFALAAQSDLQVISEDGLYAVILPGAVLVSVVPSRLIGSSLMVTYSFEGGLFLVQSSPPTPPTFNVQTGKISLNFNDESRQVTFPLQFTQVPTSVECWVVPATGSSVKFIQAAPLSDSITASGFTAVIGYPIPESGYFLYWSASLSS